MDNDERLDMAHERVKAHERQAQSLRSQAAMMLVRAAIHERWAKRYSDWLDNPELPYPGAHDDD